jgi:hypothetical protein
LLWSTVFSFKMEFLLYAFVITALLLLGFSDS